MSNQDNNNKERYTINTNELTFPTGKMRNAKVVGSPNPETDIKSTNVGGMTGKEIEAKLKADREKMASSTVAGNNSNKSNDDYSHAIDPNTGTTAVNPDNLSFIHLPDDPAYRPLPLELVKANELKPEDITYSYRIIMNLALSDYAVFRLINEDTGDVTENIKIDFKRVSMSVLQSYIDRQSKVDDLARTINLLSKLENPTREEIQNISKLQNEMTQAVRDRIYYGFKAFFKMTPDLLELYDSLDYNDILFNVDAGFFRITRSPFLRRLL